MLRFADGKAVIADNEEDLQDIFEIMNLTIKMNQYNMKINSEKTKALVCSCNERSRTQITLDGDKLEKAN